MRLPAIRFLKQWRGVGRSNGCEQRIWLPAARSRGFRSGGFTLIEVLVSALLTTLIAAAVAGALITNTDIIANQNSRSQAETLAEQDQERLKGLSAEQLDNLSQTYNVTVGGTTYTISSQAYYLSTSNGQSCTTARGRLRHLLQDDLDGHLDESVQGKTKTLATDESVITPPAGGSLLAQFHDQTASPLSGVTLAATGPESDTGTSDTSGCVIFSALPTGTYNLTYTDIGYVDPNGNASPLTDRPPPWRAPGSRRPRAATPIELGQAGAITGNFITVAPNSVGTSTQFGSSAGVKPTGCRGTRAAAPGSRWRPTARLLSRSASSIATTNRRWHIELRAVPVRVVA